MREIKRIRLTERANNIRKGSRVAFRLRSICCLFGGRCAEEEPRRTTETTRSATPASQADLGQKEAKLEKSGKEQMSHMEGGGTAKTTQHSSKL